MLSNFTSFHVSKIIYFLY